MLELETLVLALVRKGGSQNKFIYKALRVKVFDRPSLMCFPPALHEENISRMLQKHLNPVVLSQRGHFTPWAG